MTMEETKVCAVPLSLLAWQKRLISEQIVIEEKIMSLTENYHLERNHRRVPKGWMPMEEMALIRDLQIEYSSNEKLEATINQKILALMKGKK